MGMSIYQPANLMVAAAMFTFWVLCRVALARAPVSVGARAAAQ
jgi:hypothetical protein